jgi:hypothetical protein
MEYAEYAERDEPHLRNYTITPNSATRQGLGRLVPALDGRK